MWHVAGIRLHDGEELRKIAPWQYRRDGSFFPQVIFWGKHNLGQFPY